MHVQFEFTLDDVIDAHNRILARSKVWRSSQLKGRLATAFLIFLVMFLVLYKTPLIGAIAGFLGAAVGALLFPRMQTREIEKRVRAFFKETFGDARSVLCEVELRPDGVWVKQMHLQVLYEWPSVEEIKDTPDSVDIFTRPGSGVVVRNRAFSSSDEKMKFIKLARAGLRSTHSVEPNSPPSSNLSSI